MLKHLGPTQHIRQRNEHLFQLHVRLREALHDLRALGTGNEDLPFHTRQGIEALRRGLDLLVLLQSTDQLRTGIVLVVVGMGRTRK